MSIHKLQQDILRCKHIISEISIKHYSNDQNTYIEIVNEIFQEIFGDYLKNSGKIKGMQNECPNKLEPDKSPKSIKENINSKDDISIKFFTK